jgi:hypothetical protein
VPDAGVDAGVDAQRHHGQYAKMSGCKMNEYLKAGPASSLRLRLIATGIELRFGTVNGGSGTNTVVL